MIDIDGKIITIESERYLGAIYDPELNKEDADFKLSENATAHFIDKESGRININHATLKDIALTSSWRENSTYHQEISEGLNFLAKKAINSENITDRDIAHSFPAPDSYDYYYGLENAIIDAGNIIDPHPHSDGFDGAMMYQLFKDYRKAFSPVRNHNGLAQRQADVDLGKLSSIDEKLDNDLYGGTNKEVENRSRHLSSLYSVNSKYSFLIGKSLEASHSVRRDVLEEIAIMTNAMSDGLRDRKTYKDYNGHAKPINHDNHSAGRLLSLAKIAIRDDEVYQSFVKGYEDKLSIPNHPAFHINGWATKSPIVKMLEDVSGMKTKEQKRNYLQISDQLNYMNTNMVVGRKSLMNFIHTEAHTGQSLRHIIRNYYQEKDAELITSKIGKKDCALFTKNIQEAMYFNNFESDKFDTTQKELTFQTREGETLTITPKNGEQGPTLNLQFKTSEGSTIFEEDVNDKYLTRDYSKVALNSKFLSEAFQYIPKDLLQSPEELSFLSGKYKSNDKLKQEFRSQIGKHLDGEKDNQGRKASLADATSWFKSAIQSFKKDEGMKYTENYLNESEEMINKLFASAALARIQQHLPVKATFSPEDHEDNTLEEDLDEILIDDDDIPEIVQNTLLTFAPIGNQGSRGYQNKFVKWADDVHSITNRLRKQYGPTNTVDWEPATEVSVIGYQDDKEIVAFPLHSYRDIVDEGSAMSHCAGSYATSAMQGDYYLWSIKSRSATGELERVSTLGMNMDEDGLSFDQHFSFGNKAAPQDVEEMVRRYIRTLGVRHPDDRPDIYSQEENENESEYEYEDEYGFEDYDDLPYSSSVYNENFRMTSFSGEISEEDAPSVILGYDITSDDFANDAFEKVAHLMGHDAFVARIQESLEVLRDSKGNGYNQVASKALDDTLCEVLSDMENRLDR